MSEEKKIEPYSLRCDR